MLTCAMSIAYLQGKFNTYLCYILERPPCEHFNATWLLVLYMLSTCWLLDVNHLLAAEVIKHGFFVSMCFMPACHLL
jgi:hypothetical protein